jgi:predicted lipid-binding transport protein (Tim44 family)
MIRLNMMKLATVLFTLLLVFSSLSAEAARRLGGGGSMGKQSSNVTQRQQNATPAQNTNQAQNANKPNAAGQAPATPPKRQWGGILGGIAAGLGMAWLLNSLGGGALGGALSSIIMLALLAGAGFLLWKMFKRSKQSSQGNYAFAGAAGSASPVSSGYNPSHVGNDASARPWENQSTKFESSNSGSMIGAGLNQSASTGFNSLSGSQSWGVPADFDTAGFITAAKRNFAVLQAAWDKSDVDTLRAMMTDEMASEIKNQLASRGKDANGALQKTEIMSLDAQLLGIEDLGDEYLASVEFNGVIQETPFESAQPFREVWNMSKAKTGSSGWLVAGVQALQ